MLKTSLRTVTLLAAITGTVALAPALAFADDPPPTDVSADNGGTVSVDPAPGDESAGDPTGESGGEVTVTDDGSTAGDGSAVDDGTAADGGSGADDGTADYDPTIAQSGAPVPTAEGASHAAHSLGGGTHDGGDRLWKQGARRSLFGSNSPLRDWLDAN